MVRPCGLGDDWEYTGRAGAMEIAIEDEAKFIDFANSAMWIAKERVFIRSALIRDARLAALFAKNGMTHAGILFEMRHHFLGE
jgi:hypothetical protein